MSQQERYEGSPLPDKNLDIRITKPLRFADLGITSTREGLQPLGLDLAPVTNVKIDNSNSNSSTYLSLMDKQIQGYVFGKILNGLAPFGQVGVTSITADLEMPKKAVSSAQFKGGDAPRLHSIHQSDPTIGSLYLEFVNNHSQRWLMALRSGTFGLLDSPLTFVDSEELATRTFKEKLGRLNDYLSYPADSLNTIAIALFQRESKDKFVQYLSTQGGFKRTPESEIHGRFYSRPKRRKATLLKQYLGQCKEEDLQEFALNYSLMNDPCLIDLQKRRVWKRNTPWLNDQSISVVDDSHVVIQKENHQANVTIRSSPGEGGIRNWHIEEIELSDSPDALYGLMAWEKDKSGKRRFISQDEAIALYPKDLPHKDQADVFVGRVLAGSFSPLVTKNWAREIALAHGGRPQRMMGGQMSLWVSLDTKEYPHATELFNSQDSVIPKLETHIDRTAA